MLVIRVNGQTHNIDVDPDTPLLWVVRDTLGLSGTRYGCGIAQCGACTVLVDGTAVRSCVLPVSTATGREITTIEGMSANGELHPVQKVWLAHDVPQCGYCQSGVIMAVAALLKAKPKPTDADIDATITNICRCGTYQRIRACDSCHCQCVKQADDVDASCRPPFIPSQRRRHGRWACARL